MNTKRALIVIFIVALTLFVVWRLQPAMQKADIAPTDNIEETEEIHYHAGFKVIIDGEEQDFSGFEYMSVKPCGLENEDDHEHGNKVADIVHLHDSIGDVIHIHGPNATWGMVFQYLKLPNDQQITAFNRTESLDDPMNALVEENQSVLFLLGDTRGVFPFEGQHYIAEDYIEEIGSKSETCGS